VLDLNRDFRFASPIPARFVDQTAARDKILAAVLVYVASARAQPAATHCSSAAPALPVARTGAADVVRDLEWRSFVV